MRKTAGVKPVTILKEASKFIFIVIVSLHFLVSALLAQNPNAPQYSRLIQPDEIRSFLNVLASDSLEGRETGKPGQKKAARFIADYFSALGLQPASHGTYLQDFPLSLIANRGMNIEVNQEYFLFMKDYYYMDGFRNASIALDTIIFAGYGIEDVNYSDYDKIDVSGKPVMFFDGEPENGKNLIAERGHRSAWSTDWKKKLRVIYEKKPSLVFIVSDSLDRIIDSLNYSKHLEELKQINSSPTATPFIFITREMARNFFPELTEKILDKTKAKIDGKGKPKSFISKSSATVNMVTNTNRMKGQNVAGLLEGADKKDEVVVISAHYDHLGKKDTIIYNGADDNGSGTSAVMEQATVFSKAKKNGHGPRRSVLFMTMGAEEMGLLGSSYYVTHPLVPLEKTVVDLNSDMIGRTDEKHDSLGVRDYVYIIGSDKLSTTLHRINETANATYTKLELDYTFNKPGDPNRFYFRSDHYNFVKNKIPIIFYFNGTHKDYHKPSDTIDKIDFNLLAKRAQLVFFTAWELANRDERIKIDVKNDFDKE